MAANIECWKKSIEMPSHFCFDDFKSDEIEVAFFISFLVLFSFI